MATNYARATYTEVVDMQTVDGKLSVIGIHTPVGRSPYTRLKGFFTQFKKYKYNGIKSITICPASGLPIDPLGLSVQPQSTDQMDPRDTFNPILFKGCHGEALHRVLDQLMNASEYVNGGTVSSPIETGGNNAAIDNSEVSPSMRKMELDFDQLTIQAERFYYTALTDTSWKKFGIQSVIKLRNLYPLVWRVAQNMPVLPSASGNVYQTNAGEVRRPDFSNYGVVTAPGTSMEDVGSSFVSDPAGVFPNVGGNAYLQEFTNGCTRLGWLPTTTHVQGSPVARITALPKLFMGVLVLPPCYSISQFMRAVIVHSFSFKDFSSSVGAMDYTVLEPTSEDLNAPLEYTNWIDYGTSKGGTLDVFNGKAEMISDGVA